MKKHYLAIILLLSLQCMVAQIVNIPDANFKSALLNTTCADFNGDTILDGDADTNNDGEIDATEANAVIGLDVNFRFISSLEGIEAFTNLLRLDCSTNSLTALDVSQNTNLIDLDCASNDIAMLDVSVLPNLVILSANFNEFTSLTLGPNPNLERVFCTQNNLTSLDVSQLPNLRRLSAALNQLTTLDVSNNLLLEDLLIFNNFLTTLDISLNSNLDWLDVDSNQLTALDTSQNPLLETLECAFNQLTILDLSANTSLLAVFCRDNQLNGLNIQNSANTNITLFNAINNPSLACIQVDDVAYSESQASWTKDASASYNTSCPTLGTATFQEDSAIKTYPNPTTGMLQIETTNSISQINIYNVLGKEVKRFEMQAAQNSIDISNLKTGSYFVHLHDTNGNTFTKLIVKK